MTDLDTKPRAGLYQRITDQIIAELERGTIPWHKPWSTATLTQRVTKPLRHTGEPYRGINVLSLWMASTAFGFTSPFWMTYRQATELGGQVRKGEKGSLVVYANSFTKKGEGASETDAGSDDREIRFLKGYNVFNLDQIDGLTDHFESAPLEAPLDPPMRDAQAEAFFDRIGADTRHGGPRAYYAPKPDYIQLPPFECFGDAVGYYATRAHETVHWTSHEKRLNRSFDRKRFGDEGYAMEELVAELGAAFLCVDLQLTPELRPDHASYIEGWLEVLKHDNRAIFTASAHAQRACDWLHDLRARDSV